MTTLYLFDDSRARGFEPYASTRPVSELAAGTALIRERWKSALGATDVQFIAGSRHADFDESGARAASGSVPAGSIIANTRCAPALAIDPTKAERAAATCSLWRCGNRLAAVRARQAISVDAFADGSFALEQLHAGTGAVGSLNGWWIDEVWDLIRFLPEMLTGDIEAIAARDRLRTSPPAHSTVVGNHPVFVRTAAGIEPNVVFDSSGGPILISAETRVHAFTRIVGPCYLGREVQVLGGDISVCSIGDVSKIRGEMANNIFIGHSNKGHDGFIGHSYLGRWVNIGAGTITSNLKNTYGPVSLWTPDGVRNTGMQFLGTMFGDHVKTGIGLRLTTGTVVGAGSNLYGTMPPKVVAPFSWGEAPNYAEYNAEKFLETASRMMARRHAELSDRARRHWMAVYEARWTASVTES